MAWLLNCTNRFPHLLADPAFFDLVISTSNPERSSSEELIFSSEASSRRVWGQRPGQLGRDGKNF